MFSDILYQGGVFSWKSFHVSKYINTVPYINTLKAKIIISIDDKKIVYYGGQIPYNYTKIGTFPLGQQSSVICENVIEMHLEIHIVVYEKKNKTESE